MPTPIDAAAAVPLFVWDSSVVTAFRRIRVIGARPTSIAVLSTLFPRPSVETTPPLDNDVAFLSHFATLMCIDQHVNT